LDSATQLDSNYFLGYYNKLIFLNQLKQYDKEIITINRLIRLRPNANDLYLTGGITYEKMGDDISSQDYFKKSLSICDKVLDTMNIHDRDYNMLAENKAVNLIMLVQRANGNFVLKQVYQSETDSLEKKWIHSLMNKSKSEIIEMISHPEKQEAKVSEAVESN
jgi:tetratricopeptide (TPR) repeat protein